MTYNNNNIERTLGRIEAQLGLTLKEQKRDRLEFKELKQQQDEIRREQDRAANQRDDLSKRLATVEKKQSLKCEPKGAMLAKQKNTTYFPRVQWTFPRILMPFHAENNILGFSRSPVFPRFQAHFQR